MLTEGVNESLQVSSVVTLSSVQGLTKAPNGVDEGDACGCSWTLQEGGWPDCHDCRHILITSNP